MFRVIMLSDKDFSGSGNKLCEALRKEGIDIRLITRERNIHKHPVDYTIQNTDKKFLQELIDRADIIHFKGDDCPVNNWDGLNLTGKRIILSVGGSFARRHGSKDEGVRQPICDIQRYIDKTHLRTAITADLNYPEFKGVYTPQTISGEEYLYNFKGRHLIQHSPSSRNRKGTDRYILPAINMLREKYDFDFELIEGISNKECCNRKRKGTLFIDQICTTGWYGISAIESMRYGIPVMAHLSKEAIEQSGLYGIPVINAELSIQSVYDEIEKFLKTDGVQQSQETWEYFNLVHSNKSVAKKFINLYNELMSIKIEMPHYESVKTYELGDLSEYVLCRYERKLGGNAKNDINSLPKYDALALHKRGIVTIIKTDDMIKIKILRECYAGGRLCKPGMEVFAENYTVKSLVERGFCEYINENVQEIKQQDVSESDTQQVVDGSSTDTETAGIIEENNDAVEVLTTVDNEEQLAIVEDVVEEKPKRRGRRAKK